MKVVASVMLLVAPGMMELERNTPGLALGLSGPQVTWGRVTGSGVVLVG